MKANLYFHGASRAETAHKALRKYLSQAKPLSLNKNVKAFDDQSTGACRTALAKESNAEVPLDAVSGGAVVTRPVLGNNSTNNNNKKRPVLPAVTPPASKQQRLPITTASTTSSSLRVPLSPAPPGSSLAAANTAARPLLTYEEHKGAGLVAVTFDPHHVGKGASSSSVPASQPKCTVLYKFPTNVKGS